MKTYSGKEIFNKIASLHKEVNDLGAALDTVEDEIGRNSIAYKVLKENYDSKKLELQRAELKRYEPQEKEDVSSLPFE